MFKRRQEGKNQGKANATPPYGVLGTNTPGNYKKLHERLGKFYSIATLRSAKNTQQNHVKGRHNERQT
jgi:hypothetical protein